MVVGCFDEGEKKRVRRNELERCEGGRRGGVVSSRDNASNEGVRRVEWPKEEEKKEKRRKENKTKRVKMLS